MPKYQATGCGIQYFPTVADHDIYGPTSATMQIMIDGLALSD
jgi:hypothetical protein